jgi:hypothetical protein
MTINKLSPALSQAAASVTGPEEIGPIVRAGRSRRQMALDKAAALAGISPDTLWRMENGRRVSTGNLLQVLNTLDLGMMIAPRQHIAALEQHLQTLQKVQLATQE